MAQHTTRTLGKTLIGKYGRGPQQGMHLTGDPTNNKPSYVALDAYDGAGVCTTYFLFVNSSGELYIDTSIPTDEDGGGSKVGGQ